MSYPNSTSIRSLSKDENITSEVAALIELSDERDLHLKVRLDAEREAYLRGWSDGYGFAKQEEFPRPPLVVMWGESYEVMEERRYGPLPWWFTEPEDEEHPGEARRRARASVARPGDFEGFSEEAAA